MKLTKFITGSADHSVIEFFKYLYKEGDGKNKYYYEQKNTRGTKLLFISESCN
jgi:hypothetical protein